MTSHRYRPTRTNHQRVRVAWSLHCGTPSHAYTRISRRLSFMAACNVTSWSTVATNCLNQRRYCAHCMATDFPGSVVLVSFQDEWEREALNAGKPRQPSPPRSSAQPPPKSSQERFLEAQIAQIEAQPPADQRAKVRYPLY